MKKKGTVSEFRNDRNRELHAAFIHLLRTADLPLAELYAAAAKSPCSRFWVGAERAATVVARMRAGKPLGPISETRQRMFSELRRRIDRLQSLHPAMSMTEASTLAVLEPAPEFYLTPESTRVILINLRKGKEVKR